MCFPFFKMHNGREREWYVVLKAFPNIYMDGIHYFLLLWGPFAIKVCTTTSPFCHFWPTINLLEMDDKKTNVVCEYSKKIKNPTQISPLKLSGY
jgi:hypothetical protein